MTTRGLPEGRYGSRRTLPTWAVPLLAVVMVAVGLAVALVGYRNYSDPPISGERLGFTLPGGAGGGIGTVRIEFAVSRDDPSQPGVCVVRARSLDGDETGRKEVYVAPGAGRVVVTTVIRTSRPPVTADVFGCSMQVPPYLGPSGQGTGGG